MPPNQYFEGILQLRNESQALIDAVARHIEKKENVNIAKIANVPNGVDIYISSQRFLRPLGQKLQAQFGGVLKATNRLFSRNHLTSREVYRVNVLLRLPNFKKGDTIRFKGEEVEVIGMQKKVLIKNKTTGKKQSVRFEDVM